MHTSDEGSSSVVGVALVCAAAVLLSVIAMGGIVLWRHAQAHTAADAAALSAAQALWWGSSPAPCVVAGQIAQHNHATLEQCTIDGDDVQVRVAVSTGIAFINRISAQARAGPRACAVSTR